MNQKPSCPALVTTVHSTTSLRLQIVLLLWCLLSSQSVHLKSSTDLGKLLLNFIYLKRRKRYYRTVNREGWPWGPEDLGSSFPHLTVPYTSEITYPVPNSVPKKKLPVNCWSLSKTLHHCSSVSSSVYAGDDATWNTNVTRMLWGKYHFHY